MDATYDDGETFSDGDEQVDWSNVDALAVEYARIVAIDDDDERLAAARALAAQLDGGQ